jgi:hypothetical protein
MGIGGPPLRSLAPGAVDDDAGQRESHPGQHRQMRDVCTRVVAGVLVGCRHRPGEKRRDGGQAEHDQTDPGQARKPTEVAPDSPQWF